MFSPKDVSLLNPPRNLRPSDWVIDLPRPEVHVGASTLAIARQQHHSLRLGLLMEYVDKRFHKGRCFYKFLSENRSKNPLPGQFVVTDLFAYYEIEHWPGAYPHLQWTKFVMENMEYDALAEAQASEEGLTLPTIPIEAVPIFAAVKQIEGKKLAKESARTGKSVKELTAFKFERDRQKTEALGAVADPPACEAPGSEWLQSANGEPGHIGEPLPADVIVNTPVHPTHVQADRAPPSSERCIPQATLESNPRPSDPSSDLFQEFNGHLDRRQLITACHNLRLFTSISAAHAAWTTRQVKNQHRLMLRIIFAHPGSVSKTWHYCYDFARQRIHDFADRAFQHWRLHNPDVPFNENKQFPNWLRRMYEYLLATIQCKDPIPANITPQTRRFMTMKQMLVTMFRQQHILKNWTNEMRERAGERSGNRYRFEPNVVLDLWTGEVETLQQFEVRMGKLAEQSRPRPVQHAAARMT